MNNVFSDSQLKLAVEKHFTDWAIEMTKVTKTITKTRHKTSVLYGANVLIYLELFDP